MRNMKFTVLNHPTKLIAGLTTVSDEFIKEDGTKPVVEMGQLTKTRGTDGYRAAALVDGSLLTLRGIFASRSKAGHAVRARFEKDIRSEKAANRTKVGSTKTPASKKTTTKPLTADEKRIARNLRKRELRAAAKANA